MMRPSSFPLLDRPKCIFLFFPLLPSDFCTSVRVFFFFSVHMKGLLLPLFSSPPLLCRHHMGKQRERRGGGFNGLPFMVKHAEIEKSEGEIDLPNLVVGGKNLR